MLYKASASIIGQHIQLSATNLIQFVDEANAKLYRTDGIVSTCIYFGSIDQLPNWALKDCIDHSLIGFADQQDKDEAQPDGPTADSVIRKFSKWADKMETRANKNNSIPAHIECVSINKTINVHQALTAAITLIFDLYYLKGSDASLTSKEKLVSVLTDLELLLSHIDISN